MVEGWLEYIRPQARVFIETKKKTNTCEAKGRAPDTCTKRFDSN